MSRQDKPQPGHEPRPSHAHGVVKFWKPEKGWGVISSPELPHGKDAFAHYSAIVMPGYRELAAGQAVEFAHRPARQDSFEYVAEWVRPI